MSTFSVSTISADRCRLLMEEPSSKANFPPFSTLAHFNHRHRSPSFGTKRPWVGLARSTVRKVLARQQADAVFQRVAT
jgi:hypothetical protein